MAQNGPQLLRGLLTPLAEQHGLDYNIELLEPNPGEINRAFQFVACGGWLLLNYREADAFPAGSKKASRRGARWASRGFRSAGGRHAAIFLTQAMAAFMEETMIRQGASIESAKIHRRAGELVQRHYPLQNEDFEIIEQARVEYRVLDTHRVPSMSRSGYHRALEDPTFSEYDHPAEDPALVEGHLTLASSWFRATVGLKAIKMVIGDKNYAAVEDDLFAPGDSSWDALTYYAADLSWWKDVAGDWQKPAQALAIS